MSALGPSEHRSEILPSCVRHDRCRTCRRASECASHRIVFPVQRDGKIVVLKHGADEFVVFAPIQFCRLHSEIVDRFCQLRKLPTTFSGDRVDPTADGWNVHGGCYYHMDDQLGTLDIFGSSEAYGGTDLSRLRAVLESSEEFSGIAVSRR